MPCQTQAEQNATGVCEYRVHSVHHVLHHTCCFCGCALRMCCAQSLYGNKSWKVTKDPSAEEPLIMASLVCRNEAKVAVGVHPLQQGVLEKSRHCCGSSEPRFYQYDHTVPPQLAKALICQALGSAAFICGRFHATEVSHFVDQHPYHPHHPHTEKTWHKGMQCAQRFSIFEAALAISGRRLRSSSTCKSWVMGQGHSNVLRSGKISNDFDGHWMMLPPSCVLPAPQTISSVI